MAYRSRHNSKKYSLCTRQNRWIRAGTIDATASAADGALGATELSWTLNKDLDNCVKFLPSEGMNGVELRFLMATNNHTANIGIYGVRIGDVADDLVDDNLIRITDLDLTCGQQAEYDSSGVVTGKLFVDTIVAAVGTTWLGSVSVIDSAADRIARVKFDLSGYAGILVHGYSTFQSDCIVEIAGF